jgi:hypothetical protein
MTAEVRGPLVGPIGPQGPVGPTGPRGPTGPLAPTATLNVDQTITVDYLSTSVWGIDSTGAPYYDPAGPVPGEEAVLVVGLDGSLNIVKPGG